jgi:hypothetical protein
VFSNEEESHVGKRNAFFWGLMLECAEQEDDATSFEAFIPLQMAEVDTPISSAIGVGRKRAEQRRFQMAAIVTPCNADHDSRIQRLTV